MPDRSNPLRLQVLGDVRLGATAYEEQQKINELIRDGQRADSDRTGWLDRQQALTRLRFGIREKKDFPWPGCSNLSTQLIDAQIRRYKPLLMRLIVEADPIVEFVGEDPEAENSERIAEQEFNWLFKQNMDALEPMAYIVDSICHRGYGIAHIGWDYRTEYECRLVQSSEILAGLPQGADASAIAQRLIQLYDLSPDDPRAQRGVETAVRQILEGREYVKLAFKRVIADRPALWDRDPVQVIVPPRTVNYPDAEWIIVQHVLSIREIEQREADGFFKPGTAATIRGEISRSRPGADTKGSGDVSFSTSLQQEQSLHDEKERIWGAENEDNILLWETYHWHDIDGDGLKDRTITWIHPRSRLNCASRPYPYPFHCWPIVKLDFEKTSRRFHSPRGITAMLEHAQRESNAQHNARLDGMALRNAPVYQMPVMAGFTARNFRAIPGTLIRTPMGAQISPLVQDRGAFPEQFQEENLLRASAQDYVGNFDTATQGAYGGNRRTATEVNATVQLAASTSSLDAILFQIGMKKVYELIWELWVDLRPESVSYRVQGLDPSDPNAKLITVQKGQIAKKFKLVPTGTIANTNRALELENAKQALAYFANDQTGFINPYHLRNWFFTLLDFRRARKIINSPDQAQELQVLRQAAAEIQRDPGLVTSLNGAAAREPQDVQQTEVIQTPTVQE